MADIRADAVARRKRIVSLVRRNWTVEEICAELGITRRRFQQDVSRCYQLGWLDRGEVPYAPRRKPKQVLPRAPRAPLAQAALIERVAAGEDYREVASDLGIAHSTAYGWLRRAGLDGKIAASPGRRRRTPEMEAARRTFLTLVADGWTAAAAAAEVGVSATTASRWRKEAGYRHTAELRAASRPPAPKPYAELSEEAKRALEDPETFALGYLDLKASWAPWMSQVMARLYELYLSDEDEYVVLNVHPGSGKTTVVTYAFVAWLVARERALGGEPTVLLGHDTLPKARAYVRRLRSLWSFSEALVCAYGRFQPESRHAPWSEDQLLVEPLAWDAMREKEPTVTAAGYDASVLSGRYRVCIWDDLVSRRNSATREAREELQRWLEQEAETRMNPGGLFVLSGARYGPEDLTSYVRAARNFLDLDAEGSPRPLYHHIAFKAHDEERCTGTHTGPWPRGCLLNPRLAPWSRISRAASQDEARFRLVWQQEDVDPRSSLAERAWFTGGVDSTGADRPGCLDPERRFGQTGREGSPAVSAVAIDPSPSRFWGIEHWCIYADGTQVLLRGARRVLQAPELLYPLRTGGWTGLLEDWWQAYPFSYLIFERNSAQRWALQYPFFTEWAAARGVSIIGHDTGTNRGDPELGVQTLSPAYRDGLVRLPYGGHEERLFTDAFIREAISWPQGSSDDLIMAHWFLAYRLRALLATGTSAAESATWREVPAWASSTPPPWASAFAASGMMRS